MPFLYPQRRARESTEQRLRSYQGVMKGLLQVGREACRCSLPLSPPRSRSPVAQAVERSHKRKQQGQKGK